MQPLEGHSDRVYSAQFSPDGTNIVSASEEQTVREGSVARGGCVQTLEGHSDRVSLALFRQVGTDNHSVMGDSIVGIWAVCRC